MSLIGKNREINFHKNFFLQIVDENISKNIDFSLGVCIIMQTPEHIRFCFSIVESITMYQFKTPFFSKKTLFALKIIWVLFFLK